MSDSYTINDLSLEEIQERDDTAKDLYLCFGVDGADYVIEVGNIKEIIVMCDITPVPGAPEYVKGIINLRGDISPVLSLRLRLMKPEKDYDKLTCIVVLDIDDQIIGLIVDSVAGTMHIPAENIVPSPSKRTEYSEQFVKNVCKTEEGLKLLLDINKLLFGQV